VNVNGDEVSVQVCAISDPELALRADTLLAAYSA
jgi:hypothetical protein